VCPRRFRLARHLPLFPRELSPLDSPHLIAQLNAADYASPSPCVWPPRGDHGRCARPPPRSSRPGRVAAGPRDRPPCHRTRASFACVPQAMGWFEARHCAAIFNCFSIDLIPKKWCKFPKFIETCRNVQKWQIKFCMNILEPLYIVVLTKLTFVQYFIVQNYKNSNTRIFIYKHLHFRIF
jgi:hypothetical protein